MKTWDFDDLLVNDLQNSQHEWAIEKFGPEVKAYTVGGFWNLLRAALFVGRTAHHHLKQEQGIRGGPDYHAQGARLAADLARDWLDWYRAHRRVLDSPEAYQGAGAKMVLGVIEETGELANAVMLREANLRHGKVLDEDAERIQDAIADIVIYLCDLCSRNGWSMASILRRVGAEVFLRNPEDLPETKA